MGEIGPCSPLGPRIDGFFPTASEASVEFFPVREEVDDVCVFPARGIHEGDAQSAITTARVLRFYGEGMGDTGPRPAIHHHHVAGTFHSLTGGDVVVNTGEANGTFGVFRGGP